MRGEKNKNSFDLFLCFASLLLISNSSRETFHFFFLPFPSFLSCFFAHLLLSILALYFFLFFHPTLHLSHFHSFVMFEDILQSTFFLVTFLENFRVFCDFFKKFVSLKLQKLFLELFYFFLNFLIFYLWGFFKKNYFKFLLNFLWIFWDSREFFVTCLCFTLLFFVFMWIFCVFRTFQQLLSVFYEFCEFFVNFCHFSDTFVIFLLFSWIFCHFC